MDAIDELRQRGQEAIVAGIQRAAIEALVLAFDKLEVQLAVVENRLVANVSEH